MNLSLEGCLDMFRHKPITFLQHKGRSVSDIEARTIINYGLAHNIETLADIPDEVADGIVNRDPAYDEYVPKEYIQYISVERVREVLTDVLDPEEYSEDDIDSIIRQF